MLFDGEEHGRYGVFYGRTDGGLRWISPWTVTGKSS